MIRAYYYACFVFLTLGLGFGAYSLYERHQSDIAYRDVTLLLDWHSLRSLSPAGEEAKVSDGAIANAHWALIDELPEMQLCYGEETIGTLLEQGIIRSSTEFSGAPSFEVVRTQFNDDIAKGALRHGYMYQRGEETGGRLVFQTPALPEEELKLLPVAWLGEVMSEIRSRGIALNLRPGGSEFLAADGLKRTLEYCAPQSLVLFQGPTVLGYPGELADVATKLREQGQSFGWVEFDEQDGGASLASRMHPHVVRIHSIPPEEMVNYDAGGATARWMRAVEERGIRCLYLRCFTRGKVLSGSGNDYRTALIDYNKLYLAQVAGEIDAAGFNPAAEVSAPPDKPEWLEKAMQLLFVLAKGGAFLLLLAFWFPQWPRWAWHGLMALVVGKALLSLIIPQLNVFFLIETAAVFPLLGLWLAWKMYFSLTEKLQCKAGCPRRLFIALLCLAVASACSIAGGVLIHAVSWGSAEMLKITSIRGITLMLVLPALFLVGYAWHAENLPDAWDSARRRMQDYWSRMLSLWTAPIRYGDVAFILIVLGAVAVVLLRSGNESPLGVLSVETWLRGGLEDWLGVRPRTKELLGHPMFVLFLLTAAWRMRIGILFGLAGIIAQASMVNTFCHLHTPIAVTIERTLLGLGFGAATGLIWGAVALIVYALWKRVHPMVCPPAKQTNANLPKEDN